MRNNGGATLDGAAATHAAAGRGEVTQVQRFTVAANDDELRAVVVPYPTAAAHNNEWKKVHNVAYVEKLIAQQEEGQSYGMRLRQHLIADGVEVGVNQVVFDKSNEERNVRTLQEMAVIPHGLASGALGWVIDLAARRCWSGRVGRGRCQRPACRFWGRGRRALSGWLRRWRGGGGAGWRRGAAWGDECCLRRWSVRA